MTNWKLATFYACLVGIAILAGEGIARLVQPLLQGITVGVDLRATRDLYAEQREIMQRFLEHRTNDIFDPDLGWRYRPNFRSEWYSNNSRGLRGRTEYSVAPSDDVLRIAAFGDSFVYGSEVRDHEVWPAQLESLLPGVEVLNFGVGGYGTDQAYLAYEKYGRQYNPRVVLIGFTSVQVPRNVNVYRRFMSPGDMALVKPRFVLSANGNLRLIPSPIHSESEYWAYYNKPELVTLLGENDYWYSSLVYENPLYDYSLGIRMMSQSLSVARRKLLARNNMMSNGRLNPSSEAFEITKRILERFYQRTTEHGSVPIIVLFPGEEILANNGEQHPPAYEPLATYLQSQNMDHLDLVQAFRGPVSRERHFMPGRHYSPEANRLVAEAISEYLVTRGLINVRATGPVVRTRMQ